MVTALPQLWRHALRSASNGALVRLRSLSTPNVHRGERRYYVKMLIITEEHVKYNTDNCKKIIDIDIVTFVNCNWVDTLWQ